MNTKQGSALILGALVAGILWTSVSAQTTIAPVDPQTSNDAIGVRIVPNPNHYSIYRWYENQGFKGSPQPLIVDGYEALRDGRTVYVNAANIDANSKRIFTNIYLISYNQDPSAKTVDILGQIISHWKFNDNLAPEVSTCAISAVKCLTNADCSSDQICSTSDSTCILKTVKNCQVDTDCPANYYCNSLKAKVVRDIKRIGRLEEVREGLVKYREANGSYPILTGGTYLPGKTVSVWPSWNDIFLPSIGIKQPVVDPVNRLGICPLQYDTKTCWNNNNKTFVYAPIGATLQLPRDSYALVYSTNNTGSEYNLCAVMETRDASVPGLSYNFDPNPPTLSNCVTAVGILASGNASNSAPRILDVQLKGVTGKEFNGYVRATDDDGDPLTWRLETIGSTWANWSGAPVIRSTSDNNQRKIFADTAGSIGSYNIRLTVSDNKGASTTTTSVIQIVSPSGFVQTSDYEYRLDPVIPFDYTFFVSGTTAPTPQVVNGRNILVMPGITRTVTNDGTNRQRVNYSGVLNYSNKFTQDTETTYRLTTSSEVSNFVIRVKVDKPIINSDCLTQSRVGAAYSCKIGNTKQGSHLITFRTSPTVPGLSLVSGVTDPENIYLTGTTTAANDNQPTTITAFNGYGVTSTSSLNLRVNTFCGDGILNRNTEGRGGVYNDGNESCDGAGNVTSTVASSSATMQYACNTTGTTTFPLVGNSHCIFKSPLDGGGYCGDTFCQRKIGDRDLETVENCSRDCDPNDPFFMNLGGVEIKTPPTLPDQGEGGGNCASTGFGCEPGYQCTSAGVCEKMCWPIAQNRAVSIDVLEGDAVVAEQGYQSWDSGFVPYLYTGYELNNKATTPKNCEESLKRVRTPNSFVDCTVIRLDNPMCTADWASEVTSFPCPSGYTKGSQWLAEGNNCRKFSTWRSRVGWKCNATKNITVAKCYQDLCSTNTDGVNNGRMNEYGVCVANQYCSAESDCDTNENCVGLVRDCIDRSGSEASEVPCENLPHQACEGEFAQYCELKVTTRGICERDTSGTNPATPPPPLFPAGNLNPVSSLPSTVITPCTPGNYVFSDAGACTSCPIGFYCADGITAKTCEKGTYTKDGGNIVCDICDAGSYCVGRASLIGCAKGTYRSQTGGEAQKDCPDCAAGTYTDTTGKTQCTTCSPGTYNLTTRQTGCSQCSAGYYCSGGSSLIGCDAGTYRSQTGGVSQSDCTSCAEGTYTDTSGKTYCTTCSPGTFNSTTGEDTCYQCLAGHYCMGGTNVRRCPANYFRSDTGGSSLSDCSKCPAGQVSPEGSDSSSDCKKP